MAHIPDDHPGDDPNNWRKCPDCCGDGYSDEDGSYCMRCEGTGGIEATAGVSLVDGESFSHQTPIPSPMDYEGEG